jgi:hypothetical protein
MQSGCASVQRMASRRSVGVALHQFTQMLRQPSAIHRHLASSVHSGSPATKAWKGIFQLEGALRPTTVPRINCFREISGSRFMSVSTKEVFWNGTKRSLDPTAPSVVPRRPTTPSQRHTAIIDKSLLWRKGPVSKLTVGLRKSGGRNNQGVITVRHRGGGNKRRYRLVDFKRVPILEEGVIRGTVERIEYDPNRSAFIALLKHQAEGADQSATAPLSYILCPRGITVGTQVQAGRSHSPCQPNSVVVRIILIPIKKR